MTLKFKFKTRTNMLIQFIIIIMCTFIGFGRSNKIKYFSVVTKEILT